MTPVVIDASISLPFVLPDEDSETLDRILEESRAGAVRLLSASHWPLEIANGLLEAARRGRILPEERLLAWDFLHGLPIEVRESISPAATLFSLSDQDELSVYDAAYLALALDAGARLATADRELRDAAGRRGILWEPGS